MPARVPDSAAMFRWETDLAAPVLVWCRREWPNSSVGEEVNGEWAAPDIVVGAPSLLLPAALALTEREQVSLALDIDQRRLFSREELLARSCLTWGRYRREILDPLVRRGVLEETKGGWRRIKSLSPLHSRLIAIELKLTDWRKALAQARSYTLFADFAYVALPAARITTAALAAFAEQREVGLLAVGAGVEVVARPCRQRYHDQVLRQLVMERLVASAVEPARQAGSRRLPAADRGLSHGRGLP